MGANVLRRRKATTSPHRNAITNCDSSYLKAIGTMTPDSAPAVPAPTPHSTRPASRSGARQTGEFRQRETAPVC
eukprot:10454454-Alexandrium_andersonii.AAC.1